MPPKKPTSDAPPASRRSARIADQPKVESKANGSGNGKGDGKAATTSTTKKPAASKANGTTTEEAVTETETKKRSAKESAKENTEAKKAKTTSKANPSSTSRPRSKGAASKKQSTAAAAASSSEASAAKKEKEAEAPADAPAETGPRGQLKQGDKLPKITLKDNGGNDVDVSTLAGEKGVVIFLYPKADTPGCTTQACGYRDNFDRIAGYGYDIYGLSKDKPEAQQKWITKKELTYKLLCDPESKLIKRLGAFVAPNNTKRSHFIFEKGSGKLVDIALGVKPADE
ncbi:hypothetical protein I317_07632 [Kwoniella heveanensis CBS 569]|uniref:thioredoxin-dependent peroxiredoxin n=1 Tax=Kwoniella heveanensis BCC8398 TaxID=1296120 RepID=A0A1B9GJC9_9TREE|nr:hypothetical protein I316_07232 [Kwoniella heveanensis BCC8398]OCF38585.1 hypothetical protein I317_07632 [Kwoniella heveanensis CBS 569]